MPRRSFSLSSRRWAGTGYRWRPRTAARPSPGAGSRLPSSPTLAPHNTSYLWGKKDGLGNAITNSVPVTLGGLNETSVLKDNDYAFEPQRAYNVVNWERFPPFHLPPRFLTVWGSRRFSDEEHFGGPLNRGFTATATIRQGQDNLPIRQRVWFHTPDGQVSFIHGGTRGPRKICRPGRVRRLPLGVRLGRQRL